jgi:hypothetical protein
MVLAWGIQRLGSLEKIGDYNFRVEFLKEEEKWRAIEGGPWWHKGNALIVVYYDGLSRPSEMQIESVGLWILSYDLPPTMMKEVCAKVMGNQLGKYINMDTRYPSYLRVRVAFLLDKPLVPTLSVKIKGRGTMPIMLRYENVPHFYFTCGRIGHATANCVEEDMAEGGIRFGGGGDLQASPQK